MKFKAFTMKGLAKLTSTMLVFALPAFAGNQALMIDSVTGNLVNATTPNFTLTPGIQVGGADLQLNNWTATGAPSVSDDSDSGYGAGSLWVNVNNDNAYICLDASVGAAVWETLNNTDSLSVSDFDSNSDTRIDNNNGGTGIDSSGETGFPYISGGSWSVPYIFKDEDGLGSDSASAVPSQQSVKAYIDNLLDALDFLDFTEDTELTISSGAITPTQSTHRVDGEGDSSDDLVTIDSTVQNRVLFLWPESINREITVVHGTGNITTPTGSNYTIPDNSGLLLIYDGSVWRLLSSAGGGTSIGLDLGDDDVDESDAVTKITVRNDTGNFVSEPTDDEVLFDFDAAVTTDLTDVSSASWVLDEDDFASNSGTKVPTQQSAENRIQTVVGNAVSPNTSGLIEIVASAGDQGKYSAIGVDTNQHPHIAYVDGTDNDLMYVRWTGSQWVFETIESIDAEYVSMALDSNDYAHVAYHDNASENLSYATNSSGSWVVEDWDTATNTGEYTDIALDSGGNPHISYYDVGAQEIRYTASSGGGATVSVVSQGYTTSIALDSGDISYIAYNGNYADSAGGWSVTSVVSDSANNVLLIDSDDVPHLLYRDTVQDYLKYTKNDGGWTAAETIDSNGTVGYDLSAALDNNGDIFAAYREEGNGDLKRAEESAGSWSVYTVDSANNTGEYTSTAVSDRGAVNISYYDKTSGDLRYAGAGKWAHVTEQLVSDKDRELSFTIPSGTHDCIIQFKLDDAQDFSDEIIDVDTSVSESGWKIFDSSPEWLDMSDVVGTGEVPAGYRGSRIAYKFSGSDIEDGTIYYGAFRIKQDSDDDNDYSDESWSDWTGETFSW